MPANKVREYLDSRGVKYVTIRHSPASAGPRWISVFRGVRHGAVNSVSARKTSGLRRPIPRGMPTRRRARLISSTARISDRLVGSSGPRRHGHHHRSSFPRACLSHSACAASGPCRATFQFAFDRTDAAARSEPCNLSAGFQPWCGRGRGTRTFRDGSRARVRDRSPCGSGGTRPARGPADLAANARFG